MSRPSIRQILATESGAASKRDITIRVREDGDDEAYRAFGNVETRNGLQERLEIPLMLWALAIPTGGRVLEVGCGRGVALPVLSRRLRPTSLTGVDIDPDLVAIARAPRGWASRPRSSKAMCDRCPSTTALSIS